MDFLDFNGSLFSLVRFSETNFRLLAMEGYSQNA